MALDTEHQPFRVILSSLCFSPLVPFLSGLLVLSPAIALSYVLGPFHYSLCTISWKAWTFSCSPSLWSCRAHRHVILNYPLSSRPNSQVSDRHLPLDVLPIILISKCLKTNSSALLCPLSLILVSALPLLSLRPHLTLISPSSINFTSTVLCTVH